MLFIVKRTNKHITNTFFLFHCPPFYSNSLISKFGSLFESTEVTLIRSDHKQFTTSCKEYSHNVLYILELLALYCSLEHMVGRSPILPSCTLLFILELYLLFLFVDNK